MGFHAVRLACENGCDLHWYYYDLPNRIGRLPYLSSFY
jgi:hypothetical protein